MRFCFMLGNNNQGAEQNYSFPKRVLRPIRDGGETIIDYQLPMRILRPIKESPFKSHCDGNTNGR